MHVAHVESQESQVFVEEFSKTFVATQAVGHADPSKYLPLGQLEHCEFRDPVHSEQSEWHVSQVFVPVFSNFPEGQLKGHVVPSRYLDPVQLRHCVLLGPLHVLHSPWHASQVFVPVFEYFPAGHVNKH